MSSLPCISESDEEDEKEREMLGRQLEKKLLRNRKKQPRWASSKSIARIWQEQEDQNVDDIFPPNFAEDVGTVLSEEVFPNLNVDNSLDYRRDSECFINSMTLQKWTPSSPDPRAEDQNRDTAGKPFTITSLASNSDSIQDHVIEPDDRDKIDMPTSPGINDLNSDSPPSLAASGSPVILPLASSSSPAAKIRQPVISLDNELGNGLDDDLYDDLFPAPSVSQSPV